MKPYIKQFIALCLLKAAPQDIPHSQRLLGYAIGAYIGMSFLLSLFQLPMMDALLLSLIDVLLLGGLSYLLLWIRLMPERHTQIFTALAGSGAFLAFMAVPLVVLQQGATTSPPNLLLLISSVLSLCWLFWNITVIGHILRHGIETQRWIGVALAVLYIYISYSVSRSLFFASTGS